MEAALGDAIDVAHLVGSRAMLVGAWARDLCLPNTSRHGLRQTTDADLALIFPTWSDVDRFFDKASSHFIGSRPELFLRHRATDTKVDIVPCGGLERPPGNLDLQGSNRSMRTLGMVEAFDHARTLEVNGRPLLVPTPAGFVVLKAFAFLDRRAPRDLRDLGDVVRAFVYEPWSDALLMAEFAAGRMDVDDCAAWGLGVAVSEQFTSETASAFLVGITTLRAESDPIRGLLCHTQARPDQRIRSADRMLSTLRTSLSTRL